MSGRKTQQAKILARLLEVPGAEVPSYEFGRLALQYSARIKELREMGFPIRNRTERRDGQVHGFFRLELGPFGHADRHP